MIFKGIKFRLTRNIITLSRESDNDAYIRFAKLVPQGKIPPEGAVKTDYRWHEGEAAFAVPIDSDGHSRTNMMYGKPSPKTLKYNTYLALDGKVYVATRTLPPGSAKAQKLVAQ